MRGDGEKRTEQEHLAEFHADVQEGLSQEQKTLPCRWLYDQDGSELFEAITELPEYYPTRTEVGIFKNHLAAMARVIGPNAQLVEFGAGAGTKTRLLLDALDAPASYIAIDISADFLQASMAALARDYPGIDVIPVVGDFMNASDLAETDLPPGNRLAFFPGSTIGNLLDDEIVTFLSAVRSMLGAEGRFLIGFDLVKSADILIPAYDDAAGVTAAFNLNLLKRINRELDGSFDLDAFAHEARWNEADGRIEMHLVSGQEQTVRVNGDQFSFKKGETIHTENSRKFSVDGFRDLADRAGWSLQQYWSDEQDYFAVALMEQK